MLFCKPWLESVIAASVVPSKCNNTSVLLTFHMCVFPFGVCLFTQLISIIHCLSPASVPVPTGLSPYNHPLMLTKLINMDSFNQTQDYVWVYLTVKRNDNKIQDRI